MVIAVAAAVAGIGLIAMLATDDWRNRITRNRNNFRLAGVVATAAAALLPFLLGAIFPTWDELRAIAESDASIQLGAARWTSALGKVRRRPSH